jgi:integrase
MRGVEVRNLQMKRVDLMAAEIHLQKNKTKGGVRTIALNADALESAKQLVIRAQKLGANQPDHYLIPALVKAVIERAGSLSVFVVTIQEASRRAGEPHGAISRRKQD